MEFHETISTRRAIRAYKTDAVPEASLEKIRKAIQMAPTANNQQPFKVVFVRSPALRREIAEKACHQAFLAQVPIIAVVFSKKGAEFDAAIATDHLVLAATAEGLGTCWVGWFEPEIITTIVAAPEGMAPCILVPIGYAAESPTPRPRKPMDEIVAMLD